MSIEQLQEIISVYEKRRAECELDFHRLTGALLALNELRRLQESHGKDNTVSE
jgi:hypothetical protein